MKKLLIFMLCALISSGMLKAQTLAFPTAEGFGKYASGGRGGEVVEVTNLLDDPDNPPEGSFRWALNQHPGKPITIVFRVSGIIEIKKREGAKDEDREIRKNRSNITIAGQTAPGDGICFKGGTINLGGSRNLIIRHIRSRVGINGDDDSKYQPGVKVPNCFIAGASLNIENGGNFIIDHCSFSWSAEETWASTIMTIRLYNGVYQVKVFMMPATVKKHVAMMPFGVERLLHIIIICWLTTIIVLLVLVQQQRMTNTCCWM